MKRCIGLLLVFCMVIAMLPFSSLAAEEVASGTCGDNLTWTLDAGGTLTISGTGAMADFALNTIPYTDYRNSIQVVNILNGVTTIGAQAFYDFPEITSIVLPDSITAIGNWAFYNCSSLSAITLPENLTTIGDYAFADCAGIDTVSIPDSVTELGNHAFNGCTSLAITELSKNISSIGESTFANCKALTSIAIPDGVKTIGSAAFAQCSSLTEINIPSSVSSIGWRAFVDCSGLSEIRFEGNAPDIDETAFESLFADVTATAYYPANNPTWTNEVRQNYGGTITWVASETDHVHEYDADQKCECGVIGGTCGENLTWTLDEEGTLTISGTGSMYSWDTTDDVPWCAYGKAIKNVIVEDGVTTIGELAFASCSNLASIDLPNSLTSIYFCAFADCSSLTSVECPESLTYIGSHVFEHCSSLTNIELPDNLTYFGDGVFCRCTSLTNVVLPDSLTCIDSYMFWDCSSLAEIVIPANVSSISTRAFSDCTSLTRIVFEGNVPEIDTTSFENVVATAYYPANNPTWTEEARLDYGGKLTWIPDSCKDGHNYESVVTPPQCSEQGCTTYTCTVCGDSYVADEVPALNHNSFVNGICTICDSYEPAVLNGDIYEISNAGQLYWFAAKVNNGETNLNGRLMANIVVNENVLKADGSLASGWFRAWTPIGNGSEQYNGSFDGNGKTVSGLYFSNSSTNTVALFGCLGQYGQVRNLAVLDTYFRGNNCVGAIAGSNYGVVDSCYSEANINGNKNVGGIAGSVSGGFNNEYGNMYGGTVKNCYSLSYVNGNADVGGVAGYVSNMESHTVGKGDVTNSFFLTDRSASGEVDGKAVTSEEFASGEVAYYLGDAFGQTIGTDPVPIFGGAKVYLIQTGGCTSESLTYTYSNVNSDPVTTHSMVEATCEKASYCIHCGIVEGSPLGHDYLDSEKEATCTEIGYKEHRCSRCGDGYIYDEMGTIDHTYESVVIPPMCSDPGYTEHTCSSCGDTYTSDKVPATGVHYIGYTQGHIMCRGCGGGCRLSELAFIGNYGDDAFWKVKNGVLTLYPASSVVNGNHGETWIDHCGDYTWQEMALNLPEWTYGNIKLPEIHTVIIEPGITHILTDTFRDIQDNLQFAEIIFPDTVISIDMYAFYGCANLETIVLPDSVITIGKSAFQGCNKLTSITIPKNVESIGQYAFWYCDSLTSIWVDKENTHYSSDEAGVLYNKDKTVLELVPVCYEGEYIIPNGVQSISNYAFFENDKITKVVIPDSVTHIGWGQFFGCDNLETVIYCGTEEQWNNIDAEEVYINKLQFHMYSDTPNGKICTICGEVAAPLEYTGTCGDNAFWHLKDGTLTISGSGDIYDYFSPDDVPWNQCYDSIYADPVLLPEIHTVIIEPGITRIGDIVFAESTLKTITIPDSVTSIGGFTFYLCENLTNIIFPNSLNSIGDSAFSGCKKLAEITISNSVEIISGHAFANCDSLTEIGIPGSVKVVGEMAFTGCDSLQTVIIEYGVEEIGMEAFEWCENLTQITIPNSVKKIGLWAFMNCTKLPSITIPQSVEYIAESFWYCENLKEILVDEESMHYRSDGGVLLSKDGKTLVKIPEGYEGTYMIPQGVETISSFAVFQCTGLTTLVIPASVESLDVSWDAFLYGCTSLEKVICCGTAAQINDLGVVFPDHTELQYHATADDAEPDCTNAVTCTICGEVVQAALGHNFGSWIEADGKTYRICATCGCTETKITTSTGTDVFVESTEKPDVEFEVDDVTDPTDERYVLVKENLTSNAEVEREILNIFDITMEEKGVHVQPDGTVKVKLPVDWDKKTTYTVYYVDDDGNYVDMNAYRQGSHLVFETDHFSLYVLVEENLHEHSYIIKVINPTCIKKGYTIHICACGDSYADNEVPATGHSHNHYGSNEDNHWSVCSCGTIIDNTTSPHAYTDNKCICGATIVTVDIMGDAFCTVNGHTITVTSDIPCRVGYWDEESQKYIAIIAEQIDDESYSFTAPEGVTEVLVVITAELNSDNRVTASDIATLNAHIRGKKLLSAEAIFAADVNGDGLLDESDKLAMIDVILGKSQAKWDVA